MLKIKDNFNLEKLKDYGFEYRKKYYIQYIYNTSTITVRVEPIFNEEENKYFYVSVKNQGEFSYYDDFLEVIENYKEQLELDIKKVKKLFDDLIKDGIVEKVSD